MMHTSLSTLSNLWMCFLYIQLIITNCLAKTSVNVARGSKTSQSSSKFHFAMNKSMTASLAVDGDTNGNINDGSCMSTAATDNKPWMSIDLGRPTVVTGVKVTNMRAGCDMGSSANGDKVLLYPYGIAVGDSSGSFSACSNGFTTTPLVVSPAFKFFDSYQNVIYISANGLISFGYGNGASVPYSLPSGLNSIAIYMTNIQSSCGTRNDSIGNVFYRVSTDQQLLIRATGQVQRSFKAMHNYQPAWLLIVTWSGVTFYNGDLSTPTNTFQAVLISDGTLSFVIFNYEQLTWSVGQGGVNAVVGLDAGDGSRYYSLPWSMTNTTVELARSTNCGFNGRFLFRVDLPNVRLPNCPSPQPVVVQPLTSSLLYPYGSGVGDNNNSYISDCNNGYTAELTTFPAFMFYNKPQPFIQIAINGWFGFDWINGDYTPYKGHFPSSYNRLAVYWADVDLCVAGQLYYRVTTDRKILSRAVYDLQRGFPFSKLEMFQPAWALVATWAEVAFNGGPTDITNTFQAILITDGLMSFSIFNYKQLKWTTGKASGGDALTGLGGTPAAMGFNAGDNNRYYLPDVSFTQNILQLSSTSNVGIPGRWIFRVDGLNVLPSVSAPISNASSLAYLTATSQSALMYPFGANNGDTMATSFLGSCNDGATDYIYVTPGVPYFTEIYSKISASSNGQMAFGIQRYPDCPTTSSFPSGYSQLAVFWSNVYDVCGSNQQGSMSYRLTTDDTIRARLSRDVQLAYQSTTLFIPVWVVAVTWSNVKPYNSPSGTLTNTFQIVLGTDGVQTYAIFNYQQLQWYQSNCLVPAKVGFDAGDNSNSYEEQWSATSYVGNFTSNSNVGLPGRWVYRIDGVSVQTPNNPTPTGVTPSIGSSQNSQLMYPFGASASDSVPVFSSCDNGYSITPTKLSPAFPYFNQARSTIYITIDAFLTFNYYSNNYCPDPDTGFPSTKSFIAVYVNNMLPALTQAGCVNGGGSIWYRYTKDTKTLSRLSYDLQQYFNHDGIQYFRPVWAFIVTWYNVSQSGLPSLANTFQVILTTDGQMTFVMLNYQTLQWCKSSLCTNPARVVLGAGDNVNYYEHPWSETPSIMNLTNSSNCGLKGRWVYRVDGINVLQPNSPSIKAPLRSLLRVTPPITSSLLYPYGLAAGDRTGPCKLDCNNDCMEPLALDAGLPYFGVNRYQLYVCFNGYITLDYYETTSIRFTMPYTGKKLLAVFLSDLFPAVIPYGSYPKVGNIYARISTDITELAMAVHDIQQYFTYPGLDQFTPTWIMVATWFNVTYYAGSLSTPPIQPKNTFQIVLVTDGVMTFAMLNYQNITWTTDSVTGFGPTEALVGFDSGDNWNYYTHPWAMNPKLINISSASNCGVKGRWAYRIDQEAVLFPNQPGLQPSSPDAGGLSIAPTAATIEDTDPPINTTVPFVVGLTNNDPTLSPPILYNYTVCNSTLNATNGLYPVGLAPDGSVVTVQCPADLPRFRYVILQLPTSDTMTICEVEALSNDYAWMQHKQSKLGYGQYKNLTVDFMTMCLRTCMSDVNCDSVNYRPSDSTCHLLTQYNPAIVNSSDVVQDNEWEWWSHQYTDWN